ncbi:MAG: DUF4981 domain-containing protein [Clostridia bacterium]|nr:DUF4981 domain-containing protein [Clostridia bacterium]
MKKNNLLAAALLAAFMWLFFGLPGDAGSESAGVFWNGREWDGSAEGEYPNRNCDIVSVGREAARTDSVPYADAESARIGAEEYRKELSPYYRLLSQEEWAFAWYENPEAAEKSADRLFWQPDFDVSDWDRIFVPSVWQTEGYDYPIYTNTVQKFARESGNDDVGYPRDLPKAPTVYNPTGLYRHAFFVPSEWKNRRIYIVFEGVDAAMYLWINGIQAGYAEDSFTAHEFDVTDYLIPGEENIMAVKVLRWCDGSWIEDQDMFDLSGIFRDVYLYSTQQVRVRDYSIVTDFDELFINSMLQVETEVRNYLQEDAKIRLTLHLLDEEGMEIPLENAVLEQTVRAGGEDTAFFAIPVASPRKWSGEDPYLYTLILEEETEAGTEYESYRVGFRKITYKTTESGWYEGSPTDHDLIRINGQPIRFNGVNRHETHPELGYALTRDVMEEDIRILLENNINAVRTSHYPNHPYWYYLCDKFGIYLIDEANVECHSNMTAENERLTEYLSAAIVDREYSMVRRDRNHASVVMWSLGNENKNPDILRTILVQSYPDPEGRERVLHEYTKDRPWHYEQAGDMTETGIDVRSGMYALPEVLAEHGEANGILPMIECEFEHAMGNSEGNFDEYATVYDRYRNLQGGFIWDLVDQSIYLINDAGEKYFGYGGDYGEHINDGNFCANGLLLPDRTIQPEMAEVRYFYQMIRFPELNENTGELTIENWFLFTDIAEKYDFRWALKRNEQVLQEGVLDSRELHIPCVNALTNQPGTGNVYVPYTFQNEDLLPGTEFFLDLSVVLKEGNGMLKAGHTVAAEQFQLHPVLPETEAAELPECPDCRREEKTTILTGDRFIAVFDESNGQLVRYEADGKELIVQGQGPESDFFRAATDNDTGFGYGLFVFNDAWKNKGEYQLDTYTITKEENLVTIFAGGIYPALNRLRLEITYTVWGDGTIGAKVSITPRYNDSLVYIPVVGVEMTIPSALENMTWFGRGPEENYIDRNHGTFVGRYTTTVTENFIPYMKSSETGNRTDVRWIALTDDEGAGLMATAAKPIEASALHYSAEELNRHIHPWELKKTEDVILRLNAVQIGIGGDNAWSRIVTHEQYRPHEENYSFCFALSPLFAGDDPGEQSVKIRNRMDAAGL